MAGCFLLLSLVPSGVAGEMQASGLTVSKISFAGTERDLAGLKETIEIEAGGPFRDDLLQRSVALLQRKEIFSQVQASYKVTSAGVEVLFRVQEIPRLSRVKVSGNRSIPTRKLRRQIRLGGGELLTPARIEYAVKRVRQLYHDEGFEQARVEARVIRADGARADLLLVVFEGLPLIVEEVGFSGTLDFPPARLRRLVPIGAGARLRQADLKTGRERLLKFYRHQGYFDAEVEEHFERGAHARGRLTFAIAAGRRRCLRIEGNKALGDRELVGLINLYRRPVITAGTWRELVRRIEVAYRRQGFANARAELALSEGRKRCVVIGVEEGLRARVRKVRFTGNTHVSAKLLRKAMNLRGERFLPSLRRPIFVEEEIEAALERIVALYQGRGYADVSVISQKTYAADGKAVDIEVAVTEGPLYLVEKIEIAGAGGLSLPDGIAPGLPYGRRLRGELRQSLLEQLARRGYEKASVKVVAEIGEPGKRGRPVILKASIDTGPVFHVGAVTVAGNTFTRDHVVRREVDLEPAGALDRRKLDAGQDNLYRLGLFRSARVEVLPDSVTHDPLARDVVVRVTERPAGTLEYGAGYNTRDGLRSFGELSHSNLWGSGRRVSLRADVGFDAARFVPNEYLANAGGRMPRVLDSPFTVFGNVIPLRSERDVDEFSVERVTVMGGAERSWGRSLQTTWQLEFEQGRIFDVATDARLSGADEGRLREVTINPITVFDTRDDVFVPTKGIFESLRLRYGAPALGSDLHLIKVNAQHAHYLDLGGGVVGLYSARVGYARLLGSGEEVPVRERFFLGGRTSVRGFDENEIGPRGEQGSPQGGDLLVSLNSELRCPLGGAFHGAAFVDAGGLYLSRRSVSVGDFRRSAGLGLRYMTPVGPLSLDYGFKLDRRRGESIGQLHFSIGTVF